MPYKKLVPVSVENLFYIVVPVPHVAEMPGYLVKIGNSLQVPRSLFRPEASVKIRTDRRVVAGSG